MEKDIIIFVGTGLYLSGPQYSTVAKRLENYHRILLYMRDPLTIRTDKDFKFDKSFLKHFDLFIDLKHNLNFQSEKLWKSHRSYRKLIFKYLYKINPKAIITCSDLTLSNRIIASFCKHNKIPIFLLQPSFIEGRDPKEYNGIVYRTRFLIMNKVLRILKYRKQTLFGNEEKWTYLFLFSKYFVKNPKRKRTFFFGNPVFDEVFNDFSAIRTIKNNILICTQRFEVFGQEAVQQAIDIYVEAVKSRPNLNFYFKLHPTEPIDKYSKFLNEKKYPNIKIIKNENLYELFRKCDIQISGFSYASFEAAATGLPIITLSLKTSRKIVDYFQEIIDIRVRDKREIASAIDRCLTEEYWQDFLKKREFYFKKMLSSMDGNSSELIATKISNIITRESIKKDHS